jgi:pyruvate formate lyase activating enzyme
MLPIKGLQKTSLIDYAPNTCCVIFIGGCNFRCGFCHNADLVNGWEKRPGIAEDEIMQFLVKRKGWIDAVVITGGEPTLYPDIVAFVKTIKGLGYKVKIDTNGSNPQVLGELLPHVDYVAMDIKAPLEDYDDVAQTEVDKDRILESVELLKKGSTDYEFRTTVVPKYVSPEGMKKIGHWLQGAKKYVLQQYRPGKTLDPKFPKETYCKESIDDLKRIMNDFVDIVEVRGV